MAGTAVAGKCGGENQRPCTVLERVPSCNSGLVENFQLKRCVKKSQPKPKPAPDCGGEGKRPCLVTERVPSCDGGLVEDFAVNRCVKPKDGSANVAAKQASAEFEAFARRFVSENEKVAKALTAFAQGLTNGPTARYFTQGGFERDVKAQKVAEIMQNIDLAPLRRSLEGVRAHLPMTVTIGVVVEGGVGIGGSMELGLAIDISPQGGPAVLYRTFGVNAGLITGGSASVAVAFYMPRPRDIVGEARGFSFAAGRSVFQGASVGGSLGLWFAPLPEFPGGVGFDYRQFVGVAVAVSVGATVLPVDLRGSAALTQRFDGNRWVADGCGGLGKRPCHVVERVPSCRDGLREDFAKHQCVR